MAFTAEISSWPPEYCRLFAQRRPAKGGGGGHGHPRTPLATPLHEPEGVKSAEADRRTR